MQIKFNPEIHIIGEINLLLPKDWKVVSQSKSFKISVKISAL